MAALAVQRLPLLAATSCLVRGIRGEAAQQAGFGDVRWLVVASALSWGRAATALVTGAIGNLLAANAALGAWSTSPDGGAEASLRQAALAWGGVMVVAIVLLLIDTARLGRRAVPARPRPVPSRTEPESSPEVRS
jgi:hypothetical protein